MCLRSGLLLGISLTMGTMAAFAQPPAAGQRSKTSRPAAAATTKGVPRTLAEALAATYSYTPALLAERARLRATDEGVPQAIAGWRPTVIVAGSAGYADGWAGVFAPAGHSFKWSQTARDVASAQGTLSQPLYTGGRVGASVNRAKNAVYAERANLINTEETQFVNAVNAYVGVIQQRQTLQLNLNNEKVLAEQLKATQDRFRVGELTRTDVAQAEAALASATATRQTAEGNVATAEATYVQVVGYPAPSDLVEPQPLKLPVQTAEDAARVAQDNNPNVIAAIFNLASAKDAVDVAFAALLPQLSLQGQIFRLYNQLIPGTQNNGYQITANLSVPLYQGGSEYSAVRQARQTVQQQLQVVNDAKRTAIQSAVQAFQTLAAARNSAVSSRVAIQASQIAVDGVMRQALVGTATTLDVLIQQQNLLNAQVTLVNNLASLVTASYALASAIGRLTAKDLHLSVAYYDDTQYYNEVKNKLFGVGVPHEASLYHLGNRTQP